MIQSEQFYRTLFWSAVNVILRQDGVMDMPQTVLKFLWRHGTDLWERCELWEDQSVTDDWSLAELSTSYQPAEPQPRSHQQPWMLVLSWAKHQHHHHHQCHTPRGQEGKLGGCSPVSPLPEVPLLHLLLAGALWGRLSWDGRQLMWGSQSCVLTTPWQCSPWCNPLTLTHWKPEMDEKRHKHGIECRNIMPHMSPGMALG